MSRAGYERPTGDPGPGRDPGRGPFPSAGWLAAARDRWAHPAFAAARAALDARLGSYHAFLPPIPDRQAGYYHEYFCPDHAVQLVYDPADAVHHVCTVDGRVFTGQPYDGARLWSVNNHLSDAALRLALRSALDPDAVTAPGDRQAAAGVLLGYAARYRTLPRIIDREDGYVGIATFSALDEAVWIIRLAWATALLGPRLDPLDRKLIEEGLLRPAADHLDRVAWPGIHNVRGWDNGARVSLGLVLGDEALVAAAVDGEFGLRDQLARGVLADGLWWEGSLSYHYYTLAGMTWGLRSLRAAGRDFADETVVRAMHRAPISLAFPDLTLPAMNDCWYFIGLEGEVGHGIPDAAGFAETAWGWWRDPTAGWLLARAVRRGPRASLEALLDGAAEVPASPRAPAFETALAAPSGIAVLRSRGPRRSQVVAVLKAGPEGADHGHPDQLAIQLYAAGVRWVDDLGTPGYGIRLNEDWYRQTGSHASVLLDGRSQPQVSGRIRGIHGLPDGTVVAEGEVGWPGEADPRAYANARMRRWLAVGAGYLVDVVDVVAPGAQRIDLVLPVHGAFVSGPRGQGANGTRPGAPLGPGGGFAEYAGVRELRAVDGTPLVWRRGRSRLALHLPPGEPAMAAADAPGNPATERLSVLVRRRAGPAARFAAVLVPAGGGRAATPVPSVRWTDAGVEIDRGTTVDAWAIDEGGPSRV